MGRQRSFEDKDLIAAFEKHDGRVPLVATELGVAVPTVYVHARRLNLNTKRQPRDWLSDQNMTHKELIEEYTVEFTLNAYAEYLEAPRDEVRYELIRGVEKLWREGTYPGFPQPFTPGEIQLFNMLRELAENKVSPTSTEADDLFLVAERCEDIRGITQRKIEIYHKRYLDEQIRLKTGSSARSKRSKAAVKKKKKKVSKKPSGRRGRRAR